MFTHTILAQLYIHEFGRKQFTVVASTLCTMYYCRCSADALCAGNPKRAKRVMFVILCLALAWLAVMEAVTLGLKDYIPKVFTSDPNILNAFTVQMYAVAATIFLDTMNGTLAGTIVGAGWQGKGLFLNVLCYWVVGTPLAVVLTLVVHLGALGYWLGQVSGGFLLFCSYIILIATLNWNKQSELAQKIAALQEKGHKSQDCTNSPPIDKSESKSNVDNAIAHDEDTSSNSGSGLTLKNYPKPVLEPTAASSPKGETRSTTGETSSPTEETSSPTGETSSPTGETSSRTGKTSSPMGEKRQSTEHNHSATESKGMMKSGSMCSLGWKVIVFRILTVGICLILCVGAIVISQIFVYERAPCNAPIVGNETKILQTVSTSVPGLTITTSTVVNTAAHLLSPTPTPTPQAMRSNQQLLLFRK